MVAEQGGINHPLGLDEDGDPHRLKFGTQEQHWGNFLPEDFLRQGHRL